MTVFLTLTRMSGLATRVNISSGPSHVVDHLQVETTNSKGTVRSYGPFGKVFMGNVTTIHGVVYGFFGHCGNQLDVLMQFLRLVKGTTVSSKPLHQFQWCSCRSRYIGLIIIAINNNIIICCKI